jgi:hypothetical protein
MDCNLCGEVKELTEFYVRKDIRCKSGFRYSRPCIICNRKRSCDRSARLTPEEKRNSWNDWRNENKEYVNEYSRVYRKNNPNVLNKIGKKYKESKKNDIQFKISESLRKKVRYYLIENHNNNYNIELFGESTNFVRKWIEFQFTKDMGWENYGIYWEFDHIIPFYNFNLLSKDDRYECSYWSNLQPLTRVDNASKKNKIITELINYKKELASKFKNLFQ